MSNIKRFGLILISILTLIGFSKLSNSVQKAQDSTSEYIRSVGGSLDTNTAQTITEGYIVSNVVIGGVMFFIGLFFSVYLFILIVRSSTNGKTLVE